MNTATAIPGATTDNAANSGSGNTGSGNTGNGDDEDSASGTPTLANGSGIFVTASYEVSADVTKSLVTLADGSMAMTYTLPRQ